MAVNQQEEHTLAPKPTTVSSTSSFETSASTRHNDSANDLIGISHPPQAQVIGANRVPGNQLSSSPQVPPTSSHVSTTFPSSISLVPRPSHIHLSPSTGVMVPPSANPNTNTVPEFLYQLTKMLTDNNRDTIEWSNGKIEVHNPQKLQSQVLNRYFRHSKFASFQRQLNYFGFRKLAGKGKMAPCSYVNDATGNDIGSLLTIKRKTGNEVKEKGGKKRGRYDHDIPQPAVSNGSQDPNVNPVLAGILYRSTSETNDSSATPGGIQPLSRGGNPAVPISGQHTTQQALARVAVGKGIKHRFSVQSSNPSKIAVNGTTSSSALHEASATPLQEGLSALTDNFKNSLNNAQSGAQGSSQQDGATNNQAPTGQGVPPTRPRSPPPSYVPGSLRRDDSLIDLAMIPILDDNGQTTTVGTSTGMTFVDFPWQDPGGFFPSEDEAKM